GLTAAAAAAYGLYLLGSTRGQRRPVTELGNPLGLAIEYVPWGEVHYAYYHRAGQGRPLVFLHSINASASAHEMRPLVQRFAKRTQRPIFALEWLGFGHSDRPDAEYAPALLEDQLEHWLGRVLRTPGGADVVGLSLGATYAAEVARRRPDLIRSLVAIEPAGLGEEPGGIGIGWSRLLFTLPGVQRAFYDRLTSAEALRRFARNHLFSPEVEVPADFIAYGAETARAEGASRPLDDFLRGRLFPAYAPEAFARMRQPLLVIIGTVAERRMESYTHLPAVEARPHASVVRLGTGALPHWEQPDEVARQIDEFLSPAAGAEGEST
ncbi:MAG: alpha/beta fold hydrolase, partial [Gemmatimonadota bacterium]|nr:alpha/beta fold hydrolase [Gemmatimonadota bacterium]